MPLQMMPSGMGPWFDWESAWLYMVLPAVVLGVAFVIIIFLFLQRGASPQPHSTPTDSHVPLMPASVLDSHSSKNFSRLNVMGDVFQSLAPTLMDDEKRVMSELVGAGGEVLQSDLPRMTDFSKATVSKAIHSLEVRGIVVRERHKWTYWCRINPRLVERVQMGEMALLGAHGSEPSSLES